MVCAVQLGAKRSWTRIPANVANLLRTLQVLGLENASERSSLCAIPWNTYFTVRLAFLELKVNATCTNSAISSSNERKRFVPRLCNTSFEGGEVCCTVRWWCIFHVVLVFCVRCEVPSPPRGHLASTSLPLGIFWGSFAQPGSMDRNGLICLCGAWDQRSDIQFFYFWLFLILCILDATLEMKSSHCRCLQGQPFPCFRPCQTHLGIVLHSEHVVSIQRMQVLYEEICKI